MGMDDRAVLEALHVASDAVADSLAGLDDWGLAGTRYGQYHSDLAADEVAVTVLVDAGFAVLSEESGWHEPERALVAVVDPVDGSTNASRRIPWYATSICVLDGDGPRVALVVNQATAVCYEAVRGQGATRNGKRIASSGCRSLKEAIVAFSGYPHKYLGWHQYRSLGAAALDLCAVADGSLDGFATAGGSRLRSWDYMGGMLVCEEAGALVAGDTASSLTDVHGEQGLARHQVFAAATSSLLSELYESVIGSSGAA